MRRSERQKEDCLATRSSLVGRLSSWADQEGWRTFFDTYWKLLYCVAIKTGLSDTEARDVVQDTIILVAQAMRKKQFSYQKGSFRSWLLIILHRRVVDQVRKRSREGRRSFVASEKTSQSTPLLERIPAPSREGMEEIWNEEWPRNLADAALERIKHRVGAKQYQMFDLYVLKEWPVRKVAELMRVNVAQVYLAKHRITLLARKEARKLEANTNRILEDGDNWLRAKFLSPQTGKFK